MDVIFSEQAWHDSTWFQSLFEKRDFEGCSHTSLTSCCTAGFSGLPHQSRRKISSGAEVDWWTKLSTSLSQHFLLRNHRRLETPGRWLNHWLLRLLLLWSCVKGDSKWRRRDRFTARYKILQVSRLEQWTRIWIIYGINMDMDTGTGHGGRKEVCRIMQNPWILYSCPWPVAGAELLQPSGPSAKPSSAGGVWPASWGLRAKMLTLSRLGPDMSWLGH